MDTNDLPTITQLVDEEEDKKADKTAQEMWALFLQTEPKLQRIKDIQVRLQLRYVFIEAFLMGLEFTKLASLADEQLNSGQEEKVN